MENLCAYHGSNVNVQVILITFFLVLLLGCNNEVPQAIDSSNENPKRKREREKRERKTNLIECLELKFSWCVF